MTAGCGCSPSAEEAEGKEPAHAEAIAALQRLLAEESGEHERNDRDAEQEVALAGGAEVLDRFLCSPAGRVVDDELTDPEHETRHRVGHALDELAECQRDCSGGDTGDRAHPPGSRLRRVLRTHGVHHAVSPVEGTIWQRRWLS